MQTRHLRLNGNQHTLLSVLFLIAVTLLVSIVATSDRTTYASDKSTSPAQTLPSCLVAGWKVIPNTDLGHGGGTINGMELITENDIWAFGDFGSGDLRDTHSILVHWDGSQWSEGVLPDLGRGFHLTAISAAASNDVWLSGELAPAQGSSFDPLMMHWDGTVWSFVSVPLPPNSLGWPYFSKRGNAITDVSIIAPNDIWASGYTDYYGYDPPPDPRPDVENGREYFKSVMYLIHWDGTQWSTVGPFDMENPLYVASAVAPNNVWFVGPGGLKHFEDNTWTFLSLPNFGYPGVGIRDIKAISDTELWAIGNAGDGSGYITPIVFLWNGIEWQDFSPPIGESARFMGLDVVASNDIWVVGDAGCNNYNECVQVGSLVLHWDGSNWNRLTNTPRGAMLTVQAQGNGKIWTGGRSDLALLDYWNGTSWTESSANIVGESSNSLNGIAAISPTDIWAVGNYFRAKHVGGSINRSLAQHWNGTNWTIVPTANNPTNSQLNAISAISTNDIWAVGWTSDNNQAMAQRWDGTQWSFVQIPHIERSQLFGVEAISPNDVWAVGKSGWEDDPHTLILHWNGADWSIVPDPIVYGELYGISAVNANDIWAVGLDNVANNPLALHWDGTAWTGGPIVLYGQISLKGVVAVSSNNVWAVGEKVYHYYDGVWHEEETPGPNEDVFNSVVATEDEVWTAGRFRDNNAIDHSVVLHYNDQNGWTRVQMPDRGTRSNILNGVVAISPENVWAVGTYESDLAQHTLIQHYPTLFSDVLENSTFYPYIHCLACQGIIGGYDDGTFRPNTSLTRSQLAKIVSNAAGFSEPAGDQQYQDVAPGSTFYDYIWRLSDRDYIGGYPCGSAAEPCGSNSLPYFRPSGNATRGQISKIVSNAANFTDPPGPQLFEDVLPASTFYDYIQRLALHEVMGGYPCGSTGEPCGPSSLPYFRPSNNATRGQTSKIVSNSFFPGCATGGTPTPSPTAVETTTPAPTVTEEATSTPTATAGPTSTALRK